MVTWRELKGGAPREAKAAPGPAQNKALPGPTANKSGNALDGVDFASDQAAELAIRSGLTAAALKRVTPSSDNGYTKADVQKAIG